MEHTLRCEACNAFLDEDSVDGLCADCVYEVEPYVSGEDDCEEELNFDDFLVVKDDF